PSDVGLVKCVLQSGRDRAIILGGYENVAVEFADLLLPGDGPLIFARNPEVGADLVEEGQVELLEIDELDVEFFALAGEVEDPLPGDMPETTIPGGTEDDGDLQLRHEHGPSGFSNILILRLIW